MSRRSICGIILLIILLISTVGVSSAFANQWLVDGAALGAATRVSTKIHTISFTLILGVSVGQVSCEGTFEGTVESGGRGKITALLNISGEEISKTALSGLALNCKGEGGECPSGGLAEDWTLALPWTTELEVSGSEFLNKILSGGSGEPGEEDVCLNASETVNSENSCTGKLSGKAENTAESDVEVTDISKLPCTTGEWDIEIMELYFVPGKVLSIS